MVLFAKYGCQTGLGQKKSSDWSVPGPVRPTYSSSQQSAGMKLNLILLLVILGLLCYEPATSQPVENMKSKRSPQDEGAESTTPVWCNFSSPFRSV